MHAGNQEKVLSESGTDAEADRVNDLFQESPQLSFENAYARHAAAVLVKRSVGFTTLRLRQTMVPIEVRWCGGRRPLRWDALIFLGGADGLWAGPFRCVDQERLSTRQMRRGSHSRAQVDATCFECVACALSICVLAMISMHMLPHGQFARRERAGDRITVP